MHCKNQTKQPAREHVETRDHFHFYRVSPDIAPHYTSVMRNLQRSIPCQDVAKPLSRPGCWAYPDLAAGGQPTPAAD